MANERIRRLDRSEPVFHAEIGFHQSRHAELAAVARQQGMSVGLYLQTLLDRTRDEQGNLPALVPYVTRSPEEAPKTAA